LCIFERFEAKIRMKKFQIILTCFFKLLRVFKKIKGVEKIPIILKRFFMDFEGV
jgi:hypothetical protein